MKILGVIPARGGSKGISRKNIKPICGRPLIAWTIQAAQGSELLDRFVVSTEDAEIAAVAGDYGAEVLERPAELAGDEVISREVIRHALQATGAEVSVLLQPTSPIRNRDLIDRCIGTFLDGDYDSLATGFMTLVYPPHGQEHRRQDIGQVFVNDGSVVISRRAAIMAGSLFGEKRGILVTDREQNVDIDDEFDFWLAEQILLKREAHKLQPSDSKLSGPELRLLARFIQALQAEADDELVRRVTRRMIGPAVERHHDVLRTESSLAEVQSGIG